MHGENERWRGMTRWRMDKPTSQFKTQHEGFVVCIATLAAKQDTDTFDISRTNVGGVQGHIGPILADRRPCKARHSAKMARTLRQGRFGDKAASSRRRGYLVVCVFFFDL